jgi:conjugal transfer pilus assembly protein TraE
MLQTVLLQPLTLTLNRSPSHLQCWIDAIIGMTDPRTHGRMKVELLKVFNEQSGSNVSGISRSFRGLQTVVGSKDVTEEARTFRYVWSYSWVSLKLAGFGRGVNKGK